MPSPRLAVASVAPNAATARAAPRRRRPATLLPLLALLAACASTPAERAAGDSAPDDAAAPLPLPELAWEKHTLDNGLTLIVHEDSKAPVVGVQVWYEVGSMDERPGRTGFAHLFEHLMFTGSEHYDGEFFQPLIAVGATDLNGTTSTDRTNYYQTVPTPALDRALWMEAERMGWFIGAVTEDKLEREKGVVKNEYRQRLDQPYGGIWSRMVAATYPEGHPYSWPTIGRMEDIDAATMDDVREWFDAHYGAANAILVVAGDVDADVVREKVTHYFGAIDPGPTRSRPLRDIARLDGEKRDRMHDKVPQARLLMVWNVPPVFSDAATDLELIGSLLADGRSSPLRKRLVEQEAIATSVSAGVWGKRLGSQFLIDATAAEGVGLDELEAAIDEELRRFLDQGPDPAALERTRVSLYASLIRSLQNVGGSGLTGLLAESESQGGHPDAWRQRAERMRSVDADTLRRQAGEWLDHRRYVLEVLPHGDLRSGEDIADRAQMPAVTEPAPPLRLPEISRHRLSTGLPVVLAPRKGVPQVEFRLVVGAGYASDPETFPGLARMAESLRTRGTESRDAIAISDAAEALGAQISASALRDHSVLSLSAVHPFVDDSLALFADLLRHPTFPEDELQRQRQRALAAIAQEKARPAGMISRLLPPLLYGEGHPYAQPASGLGTEAALQQLRREQLLRYQRQWFRPDNAFLLVTGDIDADSLLPMLERQLGDWRPPAEPAPATPPLDAQPPERTRIYLYDRPGATQSFVASARLAPPTGSDDDIAFELVNQVLGGMFTARLNQELRVERGWSYGVGSSLGEALGPRPFYVFGAVQSDRTADTLSVIDAELRAITGGRPPTEAELEEAANSLTLTLPGRHQTLQQVAGSLTEVLRLGLPDDYYQDYVPKVLATQPQDLATPARALVRPEAMTWLVVGDRARVEAPLRALGLGEVVIIDDNGRPLDSAAP